MPGRGHAEALEVGEIKFQRSSVWIAIVFLFRKLPDISCSVFDNDTTISEQPQ